jgi:hypothetical protein
MAVNPEEEQRPYHSTEERGVLSFHRGTRSKGLIIPHRNEEQRPYPSTQERGATAVSFYRGTGSNGLIIPQRNEE